MLLLEKAETSEGTGLLQVGLGGGREIWICLSSLWISSSVDSKVSELVPC